MKRGLAAVIVLALVCASQACPADERPILAVFDMEDQGSGLAPEALRKLTDYLAALLVEGGYQIIPRDQIRERLKQEKTESYKSCYDQRCQVELGREMAAQKSLSSQVFGIGGVCRLTATLYDLEVAATERAASAKADCTERGLLDAVEEVAKKISGKAIEEETREKARMETMAAIQEKKEKKQKIAAARKEKEKVTLEVNSEPAGAEVFIDGKGRGSTPLRLTLESGESYQVRVAANGYHTYEDKIKVTKSQRIVATLEVDLSSVYEKRLETNWVDFDAEIAIGPGAWLGLGASMNIAHLKWSRFYLTCLDIGGGLAVGPGDEGWYLHVGPKMGVPLYLGARGQHQLQAGIGTYLAAADMFSVPYTADAYGLGVYFAPEARYTYLSEGGYVYGGGVRLFLYAKGFEHRAGYPYLFLLSFHIGV